MILNSVSGYPEEEHYYFYCRKRKDQVTTTNSQNVWTPIREATNVLDRKNNDALVGIKLRFTLVEHEEEEEESHNILLSDGEEPPKYNWFLDEISLPETIAETDWVLCHIFRTNIKPEFVDLPIIESESEEDEEEAEESVSAESLDLLREKNGNVLPPSPSPP
uniref:NAC domain-containing protein n=1 Tax=Noccaea caerulescens TaxID=107243 RepID=A0A1J3HC55_NOCCA